MTRMDSARFCTPVPAAGHTPADRETTYDTIADALATQGWCVLRDYFPAAGLDALTQRIDALWQQDALAHAGIGRGVDNTANATIRRDATRWLERGDAAEDMLLDAMEELRHALNRRLMLGLFSYEAHFAVYDAGAF